MLRPEQRTERVGETHQDSGSSANGGVARVDRASGDCRMLVRDVSSHGQADSRGVEVLTRCMTHEAGGRMKEEKQTIHFKETASCTWITSCTGRVPVPEGERRLRETREWSR